MKVSLEQHWSDRHQRILYKIRAEGTSKGLILNEQDLRDLIHLGQGALNDDNNTD